MAKSTKKGSLSKKSTKNNYDWGTQVVEYDVNNICTSRTCEIILMAEMAPAFSAAIDLFNDAVRNDPSSIISINNESFKMFINNMSKTSQIKVKNEPEHMKSLRFAAKEGVSYLKEYNDIPCNLTVKLLKLYVIHAIHEDVSLERNNKIQMHLRILEDEQKPSTDKPTKSKKRSSTTRSLSKSIVIDDRHLYFIINGFYDPNLIKELWNVNLPLHGIVEIADEDFTLTTELSFIFDSHSSLNSVLSSRETLLFLNGFPRYSSGSYRFDRLSSVSSPSVYTNPSISKILILDYFWTRMYKMLEEEQVQWLEHTIHMRISNFPPFISRDPKEYYLQAIDFLSEIHSKLLKIHDLKRQYDIYSNSLKVFSITAEPKLIKASDLKTYMKAMNKYTPDAFTVPLFLKALIEEVCAKKRQPESIENVSKTEIDKPQEKLASQATYVVKSVSSVMRNPVEQMSEFFSNYIESHLTYSKMFIISHKEHHKNDSLLQRKLSTKLLYTHEDNSLELQMHWYKSQAKELIKLNMDCLKTLPYIALWKRYAKFELLNVIIRAQLCENLRNKTILTEEQLEQAIQIMEFPSIRCSSSSPKVAEKSLLYPHCCRENEQSWEITSFYIPYSPIVKSPSFRKVNNDIIITIPNIGYVNSPSVYEAINISAYLWYEKLSSDVMLQQLYKAYQNYTCVLHKYCVYNNTILLRFHNNTDNFGINTTVWHESIRTPVCLRDFCKYIIHREANWINEQEVLYKASISKARTQNQSKTTSSTSNTTTPKFNFFAYDINNVFTELKGCTTIFHSLDGYKITIDRTQLLQNCNLTLNISLGGNSFILHHKEERNYHTDPLWFHFCLSDNTIIMFSKPRGKKRPLIVGEIFSTKYTNKKKRVSYNAVCKRRSTCPYFLFDEQPDDSYTIQKVPFIGYRHNIITDKGTIRYKDLLKKIKLEALDDVSMKTVEYLQLTPKKEMVITRTVALPKIFGPKYDNLIITSFNSKYFDFAEPDENNIRVYTTVVPVEEEKPPAPEIKIDTKLDSYKLDLTSFVDDVPPIPEETEIMDSTRSFSSISSNSNFDLLELTINSNTDNTMTDRRESSDMFSNDEMGSSIFDESQLLELDLTSKGSNTSQTSDSYYRSWTFTSARERLDGMINKTTDLTYKFSLSKLRSLMTPTPTTTTKSPLRSTLLSTLTLASGNPQVDKDLKVYDLNTQKLKSTPITRNTKNISDKVTQLPVRQSLLALNLTSVSHSRISLTNKSAWSINYIVNQIEDAKTRQIPQYKVLSSTLHRYRYLKKTRSYINVHIGNYIIPLPCAHPRYKIKKFLKIVKLAPLNVSRATLYKNSSYDLNITLPTGLMITSTPGIYNDLFNIKQQYISKGPQCKTVQNEDWRIFLRRGYVVVKKCNGEIEIFAPNGQVIRTTLPYSTIKTCKMFKVIRRITKSKNNTEMTKFEKQFHPLKIYRRRHVIVGSSADYKDHSSYRSHHKLNIKCKDQMYMRDEENYPFECTFTTEKGEQIKLSDSGCKRVGWVFTVVNEDVKYEECLTVNDDSTICLLNSRGELTTQFGDGTRITTWPVVASNLLTIQDDATNNADGWVSVHNYYKFEHPNYITTYYNNSIGEALLQLSNHASVLGTSEGNYTVHLNKTATASINKECVVFKSNFCSNCNQLSSTEVNIKPLYDEEYPVDSTKKLVRSYDTYEKVFFVRYDGKCYKNSDYIKRRTNRRGCKQHDTQEHQQLFILHRDLSGKKLWDSRTFNKYMTISTLKKNAEITYCGKSMRATDYAYTQIITTFRKPYYKRFMETYQYIDPQYTRSRSKPDQPRISYITNRNIFFISNMEMIKSMSEVISKLCNPSSKIPQLIKMSSDNKLDFGSYFNKTVKKVLEDRPNQPSLYSKGDCASAKSLLNKWELSRQTQSKIKQTAKLDSQTKTLGKTKSKGSTSNAKTVKNKPTSKPHINTLKKDQKPHTESDYRKCSDESSREFCIVELSECDSSTPTKRFVTKTSTTPRFFEPKNKGPTTVADVKKKIAKLESSFDALDEQGEIDDMYSYLSSGFESIALTDFSPEEYEMKRKGEKISSTYRTQYPNLRPRAEYNKTSLTKNRANSKNFPHQAGGSDWIPPTDPNINRLFRKETHSISGTSSLSDLTRGNSNLISLLRYNPRSTVPQPPPHALRPLVSPRLPRLPRFLNIFTSKKVDPQIPKETIQKHVSFIETLHMN